MIKLNDLLRPLNVPIETLWLARHQDRRMREGWTPYKLWRNRLPEFLDYQATQQPGKFSRGTHLASFVVDAVGDHIFAGLYNIGDEEPFRRTCEWRAIDYSENDGSIRYSMRRVEELQFLEGLLVIDWGPGALAWAQKASNQDKDVLEIRSRLAEAEWNGYESVLIRDSDLDSLSPNWKATLSAAGGVYLLTCPETGEQYVGSAMGANGFLGRWQAYTNNGAGGNIRLGIHREQNPGPMQISILEVFGSRMTDSNGFRAENLWKQRLGTRAHSLNAN